MSFKEEVTLRTERSEAPKYPFIRLYHNLKRRKMIRAIEELNREMKVDVKVLPTKGLPDDEDIPIKLILSDKVTPFIEDMISNGDKRVSALMLLVEMRSLNKLIGLLESSKSTDKPVLEVIVSRDPMELKMRLKILLIRVIKEEFLELLTSFQRLEESGIGVKDYLRKIADILKSSKLFSAIGLTYIDPNTHLIEPLIDWPQGYLRLCNYRQFLGLKEPKLINRGDTIQLILPLTAKVRLKETPFGVLILEIPSELSLGLTDNLIIGVYNSIVRGVDSASHKEMLDKVFRELSAIYDVSLSFGSVRSLKDLLRMIVRKAKMTLHGDVASLMLLDEHTNTLYIEYAEGLPQEIVASARQKLGEGIAGKVALTGEPALIVDATEEFIEISEAERGVKSAISVPLKSSTNKILGVLNVSKVSPFRFSEEDKQLLFNLATLAANAIEKTKLYEDLRTSYQELEETYMSVITALSRAFEAKDRYHKGHMEKVAKYAMAIALELDPKLLQDDSLRLAAMFHDLGKIAVPDEILHKPSKLTNEEYEIIKIHPEAGEIILTPLKFLKKVAKFVRHHQERWDGKGYPDGLKGEEIPLESRIIAVADAFDAMTSNRPYRKAMPIEEAVEEILRNSGTQFDPKVVEAFYSAYKKGLIP